MNSKRQNNQEKNIVHLQERKGDKVFRKIRFERLERVIEKRKL